MANLSNIHLPPSPPPPPSFPHHHHNNPVRWVGPEGEVRGLKSPRQLSCLRQGIRTHDSLLFPPWCLNHQGSPNCCSCFSYSRIPSLRLRCFHPPFMVLHFPGFSLPLGFCGFYRTGCGGAWLALCSAVTTSHLFSGCTVNFPPRFPFSQSEKMKGSINATSLHWKPRQCITSFLHRAGERN